MSIDEAVKILVENAKNLSDEDLRRIEFIIWAESTDRFVATGEFDEGPQSYDEIRGV